MLQLLDSEEVVFASQLDVMDVDGKSSVFFTINIALVNEAHISVNYGKGCPSQISKKVVFSERT